MSHTKPTPLQRKYQAIISVLDQLNTGLCVVIGDGKIIVRNAAANDILQHSDLVQLSSRGKIRCCQQEWNNKLKLTINQAAQTDGLRNTTSELLIRSTDKSDKETLLLEFSSLQDNNIHPGSLKSILLTMIEPYHMGPLSVERIIYAFQLTETEGIICNLLTQGYTTREMAEMRGVSTETVKTQIKSVMHKTCCKRRAEVIRISLQMSLPFHEVRQRHSLPDT